MAQAASAEQESGVSLRFARYGTPVVVDDRLRLAGLAAQRIRVHEPYEDRTVEFEALPLDEVLDAAYSPEWRSEEEILFTCSDGYQPSIPVQRVLEHRAWLAFSRTDQKGFTIQKRESGEDRTVELGPYYVIWSNLDDARILQEADYGWPYQVEAIDLIRTRDRFDRARDGDAGYVEAPGERVAAEGAELDHVGGEMFDADHEPPNAISKSRTMASSAALVASRHGSDA